MRQENPILGMLSKLADLLFLNILMLLGCLPIVTIGASITAGHFVALRIKRDEAKVFFDFWRSFKGNFKQATVIWFIFFAVAGGVLAILRLYGKQSVPTSIIGFVILLLEFAVSLWTFPLLSRFVDSTGKLLRNSLVLCLGRLLRTLGMLAVWALPIAAVSISLYAMPVLILWGISVPVYADACLYNKVFLKLEAEVLEKKESEEG